MVLPNFGSYLNNADASWCWVWCGRLISTIPDGEMLFIYRRPAAFGLFVLSELLGTGDFTELRHGGGPVDLDVDECCISLAMARRYMRTIGLRVEFRGSFRG